MLLLPLLPLLPLPPLPLLLLLPPPTSCAASKFFIWYSIAALRLKASMRAVSLSTSELPTERTSMPSVCEPTDSSGCSRTPRSMISAISFRAGPYCFCW